MAKKNLPRYQISAIPADGDNPEEELGLTQIAYTSTPAIITKGLAFNLNKSLVFADELKYRLAAPAMIPDLPIYRFDEELGEYEVVFSKEVIEKLREKFMLTKDKVVFNIEHNSDDAAPSYILDSWITGDPDTDPAFTKYGIKVPEGSWFIVSQFVDKEFFKREIIGNDRIGYSVEGFLGLTLDTFSKQEFETYNDYPKQATENAKIALRWAEENGWGDCGTAVGKARANQLANGENISRDTIARMAAFERHRQNSDKELGDGCGRLMWLAWGGDAGIEWAQRKLEQIDAFEDMQVYVAEPKDGESEEDFISRCIEIEINSGYPQDQAAAICYSKWENKNYNENKNENQMKLKFEIKATLADGTPIYVSALEVGGEVRIMDENGESVPVFDAEHVLSNGDVVVTVDGKITEIKPKAEEEMAEEKEEEIVKEEMAEEKEEEIVKEEMAEEKEEEIVKEEMAEEVIVEEAPADDIKAYVDSKVEELLAIIAELKSELEASKGIEEEVELEKKPLSMADNFAAFKRLR